MKTLRLILPILVAVLIAPDSSAASDQPANIQKNSNGVVTANFNSNRTHTFLSGAVVTFNAGSTVTVNGSVGGTPTGGTLDLSNVTLTLPASVSGGGSSFQPLNGQLTALGNITFSSDMLSFLASGNNTAARVALGIDSYTAHGNAGSAEEFSAATAYHSVTLDQSTSAFTFASWPSSGVARTITLEVRQDATGGRAATWPGAVTGSYEINPAADAVTFISLTTRDGGTTIHALSTYSSGGGGSGDFSSNTSSSVDNEVVLFSGTGGKTGKRATGTGIPKLTSGVLSIGMPGTDYEPARTTVDQSTAEAGSSTTVYAWTPQRVAQAIAALAGSGGAVTGDIKFILDSASVPAGWALTGANGIPAFTTPDADYKPVVKMAGTVATPTFSPTAGAIVAGSTVTFSSATSGVTFMATTNGTDPSRSVGTPGGSMVVSSNSTIEVMAYKDGAYLIDSAVASAAYTIDPVPTHGGSWTIGTDGTTHTLAGWSENISFGAGGSGGFVANMSGGAVALTLTGGTGTTTLTFSGNRTVLSSETQTGNNGQYTQPGNGAEDSAGQDVATFTGHTITNNSTETGGGFVPSDLAGLQAWYTGDDYDGTTATDLSSNSRNATQGSSGNRPSLQAAVINGHDVMRFDGGDDFLDIASGMSVSSYTVFVVAKLTPTGSAQSMVSGSSSGSPDLGINSSDRMLQEKNGTALILAGSADTTNGSFRIYHYTYNGSTAYNYLDGVQDSTGSSSETFSASINRLGRRFITDQYVSGDVAEIIIYNAVLSGGDQTSVVGYLETKYGL